MQLISASDYHCCAELDQLKSKVSEGQIDANNPALDRIMRFIQLVATEGDQQFTSSARAASKCELEHFTLTTPSCLRNPVAFLLRPEKRHTGCSL